MKKSITTLTTDGIRKLKEITIELYISIKQINLIKTSQQK